MGKAIIKDFKGIQAMEEGLQVPLPILRKVIIIMKDRKMLSVLCAISVGMS